MASALSPQLQAKLISSFGGVRFLRPTHSLHQLFGYSPDSRVLEDGDIVNIDVTVYLNVTKECLDKAISICASGVEFKKIGRTIHDHVDKYRYGVVRQFVGRAFHADPVILHNRNNDRGQMKLNQTFSIGSINPVMWNDNWTVVTEDGSLSAQFEHTILITPEGAEILTQC